MSFRTLGLWHIHAKIDALSVRRRSPHGILLHWNAATLLGVQLRGWTNCPTSQKDPQHLNLLLRTSGSLWKWPPVKLPRYPLGHWAKHDRNYVRFLSFLFISFHLCQIYSPFMWNIGFSKRTPGTSLGWKLIWATPTNWDSGTFQGCKISDEHPRHFYKGVAPLPGVWHRKG